MIAGPSPACFVVETVPRNMIRNRATTPGITRRAAHSAVEQDLGEKTWQKSS
jgi:hypothetical protein